MLSSQTHTIQYHTKKTVMKHYIILEQENESESKIVKWENSCTGNFRHVELRHLFFVNKDSRINDKGEMTAEFF